MTSMTPASAAAALALQYKAAQPPFAAFKGDKGRAWLVEGDNGPTGFIDTGDGPKEFTDLAAWQAAVEKAGITTPETDAAPAEKPAAPDAAPADQAPAEKPAEAPAAPAADAPPAPAQDAPPADAPAPADAPPADAPADQAPAADAEPDQDPEAEPQDPADDPENGISTEGVGGEDDPVEVPDDISGDLDLFPEDGPPAPAGPEAKAVQIGDIVTYSGQVGQVDLIVTDGTVPGVEGDVVGTKSHPVARVLGAEGKTAVPVADLDVADVEDGEPYEPLEALADETGLDVKALVEAYARGWKAYPGEAKTLLSQDDWAMGRAERLAAAAADTALSCNDRDLL